MMKTTMLCSALLVALAACGTGDTAADEPQDQLASPTTTTSLAAETPFEQAEADDVDPAPTTRTPIVKADLSREVDMAAADLAGRLGMGSDDIVLFSVETVTWRDGSMGCPVEGRAYTQALVEDGYRIILTANSETHHYHGAGTSAPFYCEDPQEPYRGVGPGTPQPDK